MNTQSFCRYCNGTGRRFGFDCRHCRDARQQAERRLVYERQAGPTLSDDIGSISHPLNPLNPLNPASPVSVYRAPNYSSDPSPSYSAPSRDSGSSYSSSSSDSSSSGSIGGVSE